MVTPAGMPKSPVAFHILLFFAALTVKIPTANIAPDIRHLKPESHPYRVTANTETPSPGEAFQPIRPWSSAGVTVGVIGGLIGIH
jgi:hypothetical protein